MRVAYGGRFGVLGEVMEGFWRHLGDPGGAWGAFGGSFGGPWGFLGVLGEA